MKNNLQSTLMFKMIVLVTCFMLVIFYNKSKAAGVAPVASPKVAVNFKHDTEKHELTVTVKATTATNLQLFIFNAEGELVDRYAVSSQKITTIKDLKRGFYTYECFDRDTRMKSGSLVIK